MFASTPQLYVKEIKIINKETHKVEIIKQDEDEE